ncbi:hypothetical protein DASC09_030230 [Saccharomycopsis crataegensis]|uniref:Uncharacterized protein n=1 Tax=Saccharomycopsis crataegensis TaxID=43959 RepID=A0AAV5QNF7_9ASCO|nr:hypothetical protein DASC09_030230 [Saccharomycopsis crataegensis]
MPPTVPINHYDGPRNQQNRTIRPILLFHANIFEQNACFEHSNFFKVKGSDHYSPRQAQQELTRRKGSAETSTRQYNGPASQTQRSTTSFLTATTLIYALGAGITAAAGTRLALQLLLVKVFKLYSFQVQDPKGPNQENSR